MNTAIQRFTPEPGRRLVVISDVHGNLSLFKALLNQVQFCGDDILILDGDLTEKGPDSLGLLRCLIDLKNRYEVHAVIGNVDLTNVLLSRSEDGQTQECFRRFVSGRRDVWGTSLYLEMLREQQVEFDSSKDMLPYMHLIREKYREELGYLAALPTVLSAPKHFFVHAALPTEEEEALAKCEIGQCVRANAFAEQGQTFSRYVVVGHWPVSLYRQDYPCSNPIVDRVHRIVSIDGGCTLKEDGQLNALLIQDAYSEEFSFVSCDGFPRAVALDAQAESENSFNLRWIDNEVEILEQAGDCARIRHLRTGRILRVPAEALYDCGVPAHCMDATDYHPAVSPGDQLSIISSTPCSLGWKVKKNGVSGWYTGRVAFL